MNQSRTRGRPAPPTSAAIDELMDGIGHLQAAGGPLRSLALSGHPGAFAALRHRRAALDHARQANQAIERMPLSAA